MRSVDSLETSLMLGGTEGRRRRGQQRMRWLHGITDSIDMSLSGLRDLTGRPGVLRLMGSQRVGHNWATELNWTKNSVSSSEVFLYCYCYICLNICSSHLDYRFGFWFSVPLGILFLCSFWSHMLQVTHIGIMHAQYNSLCFFASLL